MRLVAYRRDGVDGLALSRGGELRDLGPLALIDLLAAGPEALAGLERKADRGAALDPDAIAYRPPLPRPPKIVCVGLNYADHTKESPYEQPAYPTFFPRFASSLIGHREPLLRPAVSEQFDYEGELVAVIGKAAKDVSFSDALDHVAGYSVFNDGSIRDYQRRTPQWTPGKNFDGTGAFGPYFVTADSLPPGCSGLRLQTRLNGQVVQSANIDEMVFPVAELISIISRVMTLKPGDVIVTGTPSGVGHARKPQLWMKQGDLCEVEIDEVGLLSNPVKDA